MQGTIGDDRTFKMTPVEGGDVDDMGPAWGLFATLAAFGLAALVVWLVAAH